MYMYSLMLFESEGLKHDKTWRRYTYELDLAMEKLSYYRTYYRLVMMEFLSQTYI
jgi:hypothetical protein